MELASPDARREGCAVLTPRAQLEIENITKQIKDLQGRGIDFLEYDLPELKTTDFVAVMGAEKAAWFADTEGNILCLHENTDVSSTR